MSVNTETKEAGSPEHGRAILEAISKVTIFVSFHWAVALVFRAHSLGLVH